MQFLFEDYVLDLDRRELTRGSQAIATGPQVFDLLVYLIENREHVVSKDNVLDAVWAGRNVSESTLTSHVNAVRKAIGDSGGEQRLIRTIARKGFRFVGEVSEVEPSDGVAVPRAEPAGSNDAPAPALVLPDKPSIAALAFHNLSGDPEQEYFADGVVDDIITALSRISWLFVIARNSSFTYKGRAVDVKQIGRELGVRYVLEGSVRKAANRVRITGQLVDATTGAHLWSERFEGTLDDIFELQDQVAASVVGAIAPQMERAEIERAKHKPTENLNAYDYYLRGMANLNLGSREAITEALTLFEKAIQLDPDFASAYGTAAWCHFWRKVNGWMTDPREAAEGARLARRAVELGRDDAVALARGGHALAHLTGDLDGGIALHERALALNPNLAAAWFLGGFLANLEGRLRRRHRVFRARDATEPARFGNLSHAGRHGGGPSVRQAVRCGVLMGGQGNQGPAELPAGGRRRRRKPCAGRADRGEPPRDGSSAQARSRLAYFQSRRMASDPARGRHRDVRRRFAQGGPAGVTVRLLPRGCRVVGRGRGWGWRGMPEAAAPADRPPSRPFTTCFAGGGGKHRVTPGDDELFAYCNPVSPLVRFLARSISVTAIRISARVLRSGASSIACFSGAP